MFHVSNIIMLTAKKTSAHLQEGGLWQGFLEALERTIIVQDFDGLRDGDQLFTTSLHLETKMAFQAKQNQIERGWTWLNLSFLNSIYSNFYVCFDMVSLSPLHQLNFPCANFRWFLRPKCALVELLWIVVVIVRSPGGPKVWLLESGPQILCWIASLWASLLEHPRLQLSCCNLIVLRTLKESWAIQYPSEGRKNLSDSTQKCRSAKQLVCRLCKTFWSWIFSPPTDPIGERAKTRTAGQAQI